MERARQSDIQRERERAKERERKRLAERERDIAFRVLAYNTWLGFKGLGSTTDHHSNSFAYTTHTTPLNYS